MPDRPILTRLIGVYDADGGPVGEVTYFVGHLLDRFAATTGTAFASKRSDPSDR